MLFRSTTFFTEVTAEIATEVAAEVVGRTELKPNYGSGDP